MAACAVKATFSSGLSPPGNRSSRKQSEHTKWLSENYAWLLHGGTDGVMSTRKAYATREDDTRDRLRGGISLGYARAFASARANIVFNGMVRPPRSRKSDLRRKTISE